MHSCGGQSRSTSFFLSPRLIDANRRLCVAVRIYRGHSPLERRDVRETVDRSIAMPKISRDFHAIHMQSKRSDSTRAWACTTVMQTPPPKHFLLFLFLPDVRTRETSRSGPAQSVYGQRRKWPLFNLLMIRDVERRRTQFQASRGFRMALAGRTIFTS